MFAQHKFIDSNHHVALEACIRNHPVVTAQLLTKLYGTAHASLDGVKAETGIAASHIDGGNFKVGTATDEKTGIYIQLVRLKDKPNNLLTVGHKWAMERENTVQGNTSTTMW
jgi:hypothetical protein